MLVGCRRSLIHANGIGNGLNIVKVMPENGIKFGVYEVRSLSVGSMADAAGHETYMR